MVALCSGDFKLYSDASSITPCQLVIELDFKSQNTPILSTEFCTMFIIPSFKFWIAPWFSEFVWMRDGKFLSCLERYETWPWEYFLGGRIMRDLWSIIRRDERRKPCGLRFFFHISISAPSKRRKYGSFKVRLFVWFLAPQFQLRWHTNLIYLIISVVRLFIGKYLLDFIRVSSRTIERRKPLIAVSSLE